MKDANSSRPTIHFCHWLGQAFIGLFKSGVSRPKESAFLLGASVVAMSSLTAAGAEENESIEVLRPVTDQVAKSGESYEVTLKPENYLSSDNLYQRFDIVPANGSSLPSWLTITKSAELEEILHRDVEGAIENAIGHDDLLFTAHGKAGIKIWDIRDRETPILLSMIDTPGYAMGVDITWPYLHVADGPEGYQIWNLTDGLFPKTFISQIKGIWEARDVRVRNDTSFLAAETGGVRRADITDPKNPVELPPYTNTATARALAWYKDYLASAEGVRGVAFYQTDQAGDLQLIRQLIDPSWGRVDWISPDGNDLHLRASEQATVRLELSNTLNILKEHLPPKELAPAVYWLKDNLVIFVEDDTPQLLKRQMQEWGRKLLPRSEAWGTAMTHTTKKVGNRLQISDTKTIFIAEPDEQGQLTIVDQFYMYDAIGQDVSDFILIGQTLYAVIYQKIVAANLASDTLLDTYDAGRSVGGLMLHNNNLYYTRSGATGLAWLRPNFFTGKFSAFSIGISGRYGDFQIKDNLLFSGVDNNLILVDRLDSNPRPLASFAVASGYVINSYVLQGNKAYVLASNLDPAKLYIVLINDDFSLSLVSQLDLSNTFGFSARKMAMHNEMAYIAITGGYQDDPWALLTVDVSDPLNPKELDTFLLSDISGPRDLKYLNGFLFYATYTQGIYPIYVDNYRNHHTALLTTGVTRIHYHKGSYWCQVGDTTLLQYRSDSSTAQGAYYADDTIQSLLSMGQDDLWVAQRFALVDLTNEAMLSAPSSYGVASDQDVLLMLSSNELARFKYVNDSWSPDFSVSAFGSFNTLAFNNDQSLLVHPLADPPSVFLRNVSISERGALISTLLSVQPVQALALEKDRLYVADPALGLLIYTTQQQPPQQVGVFSYTEAPISKLIVEQGLVFAKAGTHLLLIDAISPAKPNLLYQQDFGAPIHDFTVHDNEIGVALGSQGWKILRVKNDGPHWITSMRLSGSRPSLDKQIYSLKLESRSPLGEHAAITPPFKLNHQHPPVAISIINDRSIDIKKAVSLPLPLNFVFTDADGDILQYQVMNLPKGLSFDALENKLMGTVLSGTQGEYTVMVTADDQQGGTATTDFQLVVLNRPPVLQLPVDQTVLIGETLSRQLSQPMATDPDGDTLVIEAGLVNNQALPGWITLNFTNNIIEITPPVGSQGSYRIQVLAEDDFGGDAQGEFSVTVPNRSPTVATLRDMEVHVGESIRQQHHNFIQDLDQDTLSTRLFWNEQEVLPNWVSVEVSMGEIIVTPPVNSQGEYRLRVEIDDQAGGQQADEISVVVLNRAPNINLPRVPSIAIGSTYKEVFDQLLYDDFDQDVLTLAVTLKDGSILPTWLQLNQTNIQITPPLASQGEYELILKVKDPLGEEVEEQLLITVPNRSPVLESIAPLQLYINEAQSVVLRADDPDKDKLTFELSQSGTSLSWVSLNNQTVTMLAPPSSQGRYQLTAQVTDALGERASQPITLTVLNRAPQFTASFRPQTAQLNRLFTFRVAPEATQDLDGDPLVLTADIPEALGWLQFNTSTRTLSGLPTLLTDNAEAVFLTVSDGEQSALAELRVSVIGSLSARQVGGQVALSYIEDQPFRLPVLEIDTPATMASATFSLSDRLAGSIQYQDRPLNSSLPGKYELWPQPVSGLNTLLRNLSFVPSQDYNRDVTVRVVIADAGLNLPTNQEWFMVGRNVNDPPVLFNAIPELTTTEEESFSYIIPKDTFQDVDGDTLSLTVTGLPGGWHYEKLNQQLSGTPTEAGTVVLNVVASDGQATSSPHAFKIKVAEKAGLIQKEDLIGILPVALTVTLIAAALTLYKRGRVRLKKVQQRLDGVVVDPIARVLLAKADELAIAGVLTRLGACLVEPSASKDLGVLVPQLRAGLLKAFSGQTASSLMSYSPYFDRLEKQLVPSIHRGVLAYAKKTGRHQAYPATLQAQATVLVEMLEWILLLGTRQGHVMSELKKIDMLMLLQYSLRNVRQRVGGSEPLKLALLRARAALSSIRDGDNLLKFILRVLGRVVPTLIGLVNFNARLWYPDLLRAKYQLAYEVDDADSAALIELGNLQRQHFTNPIVMHALIEVQAMLARRFANKSLQREVLGEGTRWWGLQKLLTHPSLLIQAEARRTLETLKSEGIISIDLLSLERGQETKLVVNPTSQINPLAAMGEEEESKHWQENPIQRRSRASLATSGPGMFSAKSPASQPPAQPTTEVLNPISGLH